MRLVSSLGAGATTILFCVLLATPLLADDPLPPPEKVTAWSGNHSYFVESLPGGETTVYRMPESKAAWTIPGWHRSVLVSNSGVVAICYGGINLLPLNYKADLVIIELWKDGQMIRQIRLRDLIHNLKLLQRTVSHYSWGHVIGFNKDDLLDVVTVERKISIDPENGNILNQPARRKKPTIGDTHNRVPGAPHLL